MVSLPLALSGSLPLPEPAAAYFRSLGFLDYAEFTLKFGLLAAGIYFMFRMRVAAIYSLGAVFILGQLVWLARFEEFRAMGQGVGSWMSGVAFSLGVLLYLWHLK